MAGLHWSELPADVVASLRHGVVIPAHPLALDERRQFDRVSQRALSRYYIDAGSGGLAVGVHATQFQIRDVGLYQPVLELAAETAQSWTRRPLVMIPGFGGRSRSLTAYDDAAAELWSQLGFAVRCLPGWAPFSFAGGALRCAAKVLRRGPFDGDERVIADTVLRRIEALL